MRTRRTILRAEILEDRTAPATWGNPWPDPTHLTLSFAPDGTQVAGQTSNLFQTMNAIAPTKVWETEILRAVQTWAAQTNINVSVVPDQGLPFGTAGAIQGDARFGDIRIAAYKMPAGAEATASPFELAAGTWSGDIEFNSAALFGVNGQGQYDLFSVALHEAGHVFGFADNSNPASVMDMQYLGVRTGLGAADVTAVQSLYGGARSLNQAGPNNNQFSTATRLNALTNLEGLLPMSVNADLSTPTDQDFYSFSALLGLGGADVTVRTAGISLMTPRATVFDAFGRKIVSTVTTDPQQGGFVIHLANLAPLSTYYVEIQGGQSNVFGIGSYSLTVAELPLVSWLLGGVTATVTDGLGAITNVLINNDPLHTNASFGTATPLPTMTPGPNASYYDTYRASLSDATDVDYYRIQAPSVVPHGAGETLTAMVWGLQNDMDPSVRVFDAQHNLLAGQVLVNDGFSDVVQIAGAQPGATYYVEVLPSGSGSQAAGNYFLGIDFSPVAAALQTYTAGALTASQPTAIQTLTVTDRSQLFHFVLSATTSAPTSAATVQMTVTNATGHIVFNLTAGTTEAVTGNVILDPGRYTVVFWGRAKPGSTLPALTYSLLGEVLTDPEGPEPTDPSGDPGGSSNNDPNNQFNWTGGSSGGVPGQDPSSNPSSGSNSGNVVTLYGPGDQTNLAGDSLSWTLSASDSNNDALIFSAAGLPPGLSIDPNAGTISGAIPNNAAQAKPYVVTVTATDANDGTNASQTFYWTVNPPVITLYSPGDQTNNGGDAVSFTLGAYASDNYPLTFSATGLPPGLTIDPDSGTVSGVIANNAAQTGPYVVTVTATDASSGVNATQTFNWTVNPPVITLYSPGDQTNNGGDAVSFTLGAYASDNYPLTFSATGLPPGLSIDPSSGTISGAIANNAAQAGPYVVTVTATDASSSVTASQTFNWTVNPPVITLYSPGDQANNGGDTVSFTLGAYASDNYALTFSATGLPPGLSIDPSAGTISGTIAGNATSANPYVVTFTATDPSSGVSVTVTINWTVN